MLFCYILYTILFLFDTGYEMTRRIYVMRRKRVGGRNMRYLDLDIESVGIGNGVFMRQLW